MGACVITLDEASSFQLKHLIYASSPETDFPEEALLEMLQDFRSNNTALAITGLLLYGEGKFMQYLEGSADDLNALVERIRKDKRHKNFRVLSEGDIAERLFSHWSMAYRSLRGVTADQIPGYRDILNSAAVTNAEANTDLCSLELLSLFRELSPEAFESDLHDDLFLGQP